MSPLAVELVRRLSWFALGLAALLLLVPAGLTELGLWGPSVVDQLAGAERRLATARAYGGREDDPSYREAQADVEQARKLIAQGEEWRARQLVRRASAHAVEAQRAALTSRESSRRQAALVGVEIDRRLDELEELYAQVTPGSDKQTVSALLSTMKEARRQGAGVLLAIEEGEYGRAIAQEPAARQTLDAARQRLESARRPRTGSP
jgi:hypothetical protein